MICCGNTTCEWQGCLQDAGRKNFWFFYCPACGDVNSVLGGVIRAS